MSRQFDDEYSTMNASRKRLFDCECELAERASEIIARNDNDNPQSDYDEGGLLSFLKDDTFDDIPTREIDVEPLFADDCHRIKCERCHREVIFSNKNIHPGVISGRNVENDPYIICPYCLKKNEKLNFLPKNKRFYNSK